MGLGSPRSVELSGRGTSHPAWHGNALCATRKGHPREQREPGKTQATRWPSLRTTLLDGVSTSLGWGRGIQRTSAQGWNTREKPGCRGGWEMRGSEEAEPTTQFRCAEEGKSELDSTPGHLSAVRVLRGVSGCCRPPSNPEFPSQGRLGAWTREETALNGSEVRGASAGRIPTREWLSTPALHPVPAT